MLVPLDGSTRAKAAIAPAAKLISGLSAPSQGVLHLLRVAKPVHANGESSHTEDVEHTVEKASKYLSTTIEHIREGLVATPTGDLNLAVNYSVVVDTDPAATIIKVAENGESAEGTGPFGRCDVIAMATHGRSGLQRWAMGIVTERVLNATRLPILIIRPEDMIDKKDHEWHKSYTATH
jgi:nucleotide-binding universal stress UspA family protein